MSSITATMAPAWVRHIRRVGARWWPSSSTTGGGDREQETTMLTFANWSIRYKLLSLLLLLAVITLAVTGTIAYFKNLTALRENVFNQLTGVTRSKRSQIDSYYETIHNHVETLSYARMFIDAMREFRDAYRKLNEAPIQASTLKAVTDDYRN